MTKNGKHITGDELQDFLRGRHFGALFGKLGWDCEELMPIPPLKVGGKTLTIAPVAVKRGFVVCICEDAGDLPDSKAGRKRIAAELSRYHYEHLLILCGEDRQRWMLAIRPQDRPVQTAEVEWHHHQNPRALAEKLKGLFFRISEEDGLYLSDVVEKVRGAFLQNHEAVTRRFYGKFQKELERFADFIKGVRDKVEQKWYAALTLNRLMFIYFLQKRGFLDGNTDYLADKLRETRKEYGKDKFERVFYRKFLRRLFAEGLNAPEAERSPQLHKMLGKVPYLNGGLFDLHDIEKSRPKLDIPDAAFDGIFSFFDKYRWHLDTRPQAAGNEINPDVIGYIFEKYINDRAKMGAYYTQEDVTGYIARSSIIPFLLEKARAECANAFDAQRGIWRFLRENPQNYIYDAVQKGCHIPDSELPPNIRRGLDAKAPNLQERRADWNAPADGRFGLPGETWRETIARRIRCQKLTAKIACGEVCTTADLITDNLDIERFAAVALDSYEGSDFIDAFFIAIAGKPPHNGKRHGISVLDPACGSGAFLFAALNVLEPLYQKCLDRMEVFVGEDDSLRERGERKGAKKHRHFRQTLADIQKHPNRDYWVYKQIILNNLYGVDLMREAAEIAKLRLFLKLAAAAGDADPAKENLGLEPLPDIDFNIRSGNSLVGYASMKQFDELDGRGLLDKKTTDAVRNRMRAVQLADADFCQSQSKAPKEYRAAKRKLEKELHALNEQLNRYLAIQDGKKIESTIKKWAASHRPFHWLANFHDIVENRGGFDVVIGNPPYVGYDQVRKQYQVKNYCTEKCNDLYAFLIERSATLLHPQGYTAMIVPLSLGVSQNKESCRDLLFGNYGTNWFSSFGRIPSGLFPSDVRVRNTIHIGGKHAQDKKCYTTRLHRWKQEARFALLNTMEYSPFRPSAWKTIPKLNTPALVGAFENMLAHGKSVKKAVGGVTNSKHLLYYKTNAYNWLAFCRKPIPCYKGDTPIAHTSTGILYFRDAETRDIAMLLANGKIAMSYWLATGDDFRVAATSLCDFPCNLSDISAKDRESLLAFIPKLEEAMDKALQFKLNAGVRSGNYNLVKCRHVTDRSDALFARIFGIDAVALADIDLYHSQVVKTDFSTE